MKHGAPVKFLILLIGGWTCIRLVASAPYWGPTDFTNSQPRSRIAARGAISASLAAQRMPASRMVSSDPNSGRLDPLRSPAITQGTSTSDSWRTRLALRATAPAAGATPRSAPVVPARVRSPMPSLAANPPAPAWAAPLPPAASSPPSRLTGSAWLLVRRDGEKGLAPGGVLGGSQVGARLIYRINGDHRRPLSVSARLYSPLRRRAVAEAAIGLDWQPMRRLPVHLLLERRQRLGRDGRSAFGMTAYGGGSVPLGGGWQVDGYAQAGIVGLRSRDLFVDGSARIARRIGPLDVGAAIWGAAQPGAARMDTGPHLALPFRVGGASFRLSADYRFRIAGQARPASGPALSLGVDF